MFIDGDHAIFSSKRFLVVDDFQGMRTMFREMLKSCGAKEIDVATNGKEAIALLEVNKYDVVLCDYNLGAGKNGQQVMEEAKVRNLIGLATAWIVVSAEKTTEMVLGAMEYMPDDYIIKPFTEAIIRSRLLAAISRKELLHDVEKAIYEKDYASAITLCDEKLKSGIGHAGDLIRMKVGLLITAGRRKQAKELVEKVLAQRDVPWAKVDLAKVHYLEGELDLARDLLLQVTEENRTYMGAYDLLAKIFEEKGDLEEAQSVLVCSIDLSPNSATRQKALGDIAQKLGDLDLAEKVLAQRDVPWAKVDLAKVHYLEGELDLARDLLLQVTEVNRTYMGAYDLLAKIFEEKGDLEEAQSVLVCSIDLSPNSATRQKALGDIAQKLGDLDLAEKAFRKTIALTEHSVLKVPSAYIGLAKICTEKNNPSEAMRVLGEVQKTFDCTQSTIHAKVIEGTLYRKNRDMKAAQQTAKEVVGLVKGAASALPASVALEAAEFIMGNGDAATAAELLKAVVLNNHENEAVLEQVRAVFKRADMEEDGEKLVTASLREVVDCNNQAVHLAQAGKLEEAIAMLRDARKMMPGNKRILLNLSYALILLMQKNGSRELAMDREVRDYLEQVRKLDPGNEQCGKYRNALDAMPIARAAA